MENTKETPVVAIDKNKKTYNEVLQLNSTLQMLSQSKHPFNIAIAKNLKTVEAILKDYNDKRELIIDEFAIRDEKGDFIGAMIDDPKGEKDEDGKIKQVRAENPQKISDIEWSDKDAIVAKLNELGAQKTDVVLSPVDVKKSYLDTKINKELTIESYLDTNFESGLLLYLNVFGFFTNLDI